MNLEKERELFEAWAKENTKWDLYWSENINQYMDHTANAAWLSWLASASREGYKLVPVEPDKQMIYAGESAEHKGCISVAVVYKAMIGAVE